jgi:hypothetical protein
MDVFHFIYIKDDNTVKPFNREDYFPEWNTLSVGDRKVFFIRDRNRDGTEIHATITGVINTQLSSLFGPARSLYPAEGNKARITKAYTNRDLRLNYNVTVTCSRFPGVNVIRQLK